MFDFRQMCNAALCLFAILVKKYRKLYFFRKNTEKKTPNLERNQLYHSITILPKARNIIVHSLAPPLPPSL